MKNLFLNTFADVKGITIGKAKVRIANMVWQVIKNVYLNQGYTASELKDAYDIFMGYKLQEVFDLGHIEVEGKDFNFMKLL